MCRFSAHLGFTIIKNFWRFYHEKSSQKGSALTKEEEEGKLVEYCRNRKDDVASALLVLLYFGLRQSELPSIKIIDDNTLECETSKERMGRNVTLRYIPFTPMFRKIKSLVDFEKAKNINVYTLRSAFKRLFPEHHPHELRYTFITRCKECVQKGNLKIIIALKQPKFNAKSKQQLYKFA